MVHGLNPSKMDQGSKLDPASWDELARAQNDRSACSPGREPRWQADRNPKALGVDGSLRSHRAHEGLRMVGKRAGVPGLPAAQSFIVASPLTFRFGSYWLCDAGLVAPLSSPWLFIHKLGVGVTPSPGGGHEDEMKIRELHQE